MYAEAFAEDRSRNDIALLVLKGTVMMMMMRPVCVCVCVCVCV